MQPVVDRLERKYEGSVDFVIYADTGANAEIRSFAAKQGVTYVPTMMIVAADGTEVERIVGSLPETDLDAKLDSAR